MPHSDPMLSNCYCRGRLHIALTLLVCGAFLSCSTAVTGKEASGLNAEESADALADFAINGMNANIENLRTGEVVIRGACSALGKTSGKMRRFNEMAPLWEKQLSRQQFESLKKESAAPAPLLPDFSIHCVFDFEKNRVRFDRTEGQMQGRYIRTPEVGIVDVLQNGSNAGTITKLNPDKYPGVAVRFFDVRGIGLYTNPDLGRNRDLTTNKVDIFSRLTLERAAETIDGNVVLAFIGKNKDIEWNLTIDKNRGMSPTHLDQSYATPIALSEDNRLLRSADTTWKQFDEVWLPTESIVRDHSKGLEITMSLNWRNVNRPVGTEQFQISSFAPADGTLIVDKRLGGQSIIESIVGRQIDLDEVPDPYWSFRRIAIYLNLLAILVIIALYLHRKYRRVTM
jgi:hypothetical protein